jgi:hypothetical protein
MFYSYRNVKKRKDFAALRNITIRFFHCLFSKRTVHLQRLSSQYACRLLDARKPRKMRWRFEEKILRTLDDNRAAAEAGLLCVLNCLVDRGRKGFDRVKNQYKKIRLIIHHLISEAES